MEDNENSWLQRENVVVHLKNKKIIFSNPLLGERTPQFYEIERIAVLMKHYEVYLWLGDRNNFADCVPLFDTSEFWKKRGMAHAATL